MVCDVTGREIKEGDHVISNVSKYPDLFLCEVMKVHPKMVTLCVIDTRPDLPYYVQRAHKNGVQKMSASFPCQPFKRFGHQVFIPGTDIAALKAEHEAALEAAKETAWQNGYDVGHGAGQDLIRASMED